jgi:non-ribosomal peptide synthetase component E (peptide arylation enzyme)
MINGWLKEQGISHQLPEIIEFTETIPTNFLGEIDKIIS